MKIESAFCLILLAIIAGSVHAMKIDPFIAFSGGYGSYQNMYESDGSTSATRLAMGGTVMLSGNLQIGIEGGIQTGNRMRLSNAILLPLQPLTLPVFITIRPPIDLLALIEYDLSPVYSLICKAGVVYLKTVPDNTTIHIKPLVAPELQFGLGYTLTSKAKVSLIYQRMFTSSPDLESVNVDDGTATLSNPPPFQALFVTLAFAL